MAYNVVSLILDITDGTGALIGLGSVKLSPSAQLTDANDNLLAIQSPVWAALNGVAFPKVSLIATDNANLLPSGWAWTLSFPAVPGSPAAFNVFLPAGSQTFTANNASPCVFTASGAGYLNNTGVQLSGGSLPTGFSAATTYYVVAASGSTFQLAATVGGAALGSTSTGSGSVIAVSSYLSSLAPVSSVTTMAAYMPLPTGSPSSGQVPVATGSGEASAWGSVATNPMTTTGDMITGGASGAPQRLAVGTAGQVLTVSGGAPSWQASGSGFSNPMTTLGDIIYENATPAAARLAGSTSSTKNFLTQTGTGSVSAAPAWGTIAAGDVPTLNQNTTGTAAGLSATLAIGSGGTGQVTAAAAYNALSPMTTLGDIEYESGASTASRLAGNTTSALNLLTQTGTGSVSAAPGWQTPDAAGVVDKASTQTIAGAKTFSLPPNLATQSVSGTATLSAASAPVVLTDTTTAAFTLTLPAAPVTGEWFIIIDDTGQWNTHTLTIGRNGKNIDGAASNLTLVNQWGKVWLYYDGTAWWSLANGLSNENPVATGSVSAGTHNSASRADHVHPTTGLVTGVTATDTSIVVSGTSQAPTIATGTLDVIATQHAPAANWSNNSHKITSLANGSAAQDAAAWGQTVSGILTTLGDLVYENSTPAPARLAGSTSATKQFLTQTGTGSVSAAPAWGTIQAGDVPDLAYVDSVSATDSSIVITGAADTPSIASVPAQFTQRIFAV